MNITMHREPEVLTLTCENTKTAQRMALAILDTLSSIRDDVDVSGVRVEQRAECVIIEGDIDLAAGAIEVACDVDLTLPDVVPS
jgi:hypothetical protein